MKIGFANGVFDGLHAGHRFFLEKASHHCSWLIIAVNTDESVRALKGNERPTIPLESRVRALHLTGFANAILPFHGDPVPLIKSLRPHVLIRSTTAIFNATH